MTGTARGDVRLVLADDQAMVRAGLALILGSEPGLRIVAECGDGAEAVQAVQRLGPDLVLMDVRMPGVDGLEATRRIVGGSNACPVLIITTFDDDEVLWGAVDAGAGGFVLKDSSAEDLIGAVRAVAAGGAWLDPRVTPRLLEVLRRDGGRRAAPPGFEQLTERERDVLHLMASGANNLEIARRLHVSERTVKTHVGSIFTKLGARDRAAAIVLAYEAGFARPGPPR